jgi:hypothetical protein
MEVVKMRKKAQNAGQILVYVLTVVIMGAILLFGYRSIMDFKSRTDKISMVDFQKKLESSINTITPDFGTMRRKTFLLSTEFKEVCFVTNYGTPVFDADEFAGYPIIEDSVESQTGNNIFLITVDGEISESFGLGEIRTPGDFNCVPIVDARLSVSIEGKGDHVVIS